MFARVLCCAFCALFASPVAAEILVQDGDYYPELIGHEPIRITGGRIDKLIVGGYQTTIEGGSFGQIHDVGDTPFLFRSGNVTMDLPIRFDEVPRVIFEGFRFREISFRPQQISIGGLYVDYTPGWVTVNINPDFCDGSECQTRTGYIIHEHLLGDTNGDQLVDLQDLNNVRTYWATLGPGDADIDGDTDLDDLNAVRNNFGATLDPIPEPSTFTLALAGCVVLAVRRRITKPVLAGGR